MSEDNWEVNDREVMKKSLAVIESAIKFRDKVNRESPECFTPSKELQTLFDKLEEMGV